MSPTPLLPVHGRYIGFVEVYMPTKTYLAMPTWQCASLGAILARPGIPGNPGPAGSRKPRNPSKSRRTGSRNSRKPRPAGHPTQGTWQTWQSHKHRREGEVTSQIWGTSSLRPTQQPTYIFPLSMLPLAGIEMGRVYIQPS